MSDDKEKKEAEKDKDVSIGEVAKEAAVAIVKDVYANGLKPAVQRAGNVLGTLAGVVDVALTPFELMVYAVDAKKKAVKERIGQILHERGVPAERVTPPKATVAGPALQAIFFAEDAPELRNLFAGLLATAMDRDTARLAHPAFTEVLRQISPDEARIVRWLAEHQEANVYSIVTERYYPDGGTFSTGRATFVAAGETHEHTVCAEHMWVIGEDAGCEYIDLVPNYMDNITRLGLVKFDHVPEQTCGFGADALLGFNRDNPNLDTKYRPEMARLMKLYPNVVSEAIELFVSQLVSEQVAGSRLDIYEQKAALTHFGRQFCDVCVGAQPASNCD